MLRFDPPSGQTLNRRDLSSAQVTRLVENIDTSTEDQSFAELQNIMSQVKAGIKALRAQVLCYMMIMFIATLTRG